MIRRGTYDKNVFRINQFVGMVVFDPEQGKLNLYSQVLQVDEKNFVIAWPNDIQGQKFFFRDINFAVVQCLIGSEVVSFKVAIENQHLEKFDTGHMRFSTPKFMDALLQKRAYERIRREVDLKFRILTDEGFSQKLYEGLTNDISVGGMEFGSMTLLEPGVEIEAKFTLEFFDFMGVTAKIIRRSETEENGNLEYIYACQFTGIFERERLALNQILLRHSTPLPSPRILPQDNDNL
ncbi:MAG: PilZ domain-containing protein [bacterium]|nr:PilZ domain-containing protein [bacterium]